MYVASVCYCRKGEWLERVIKVAILHTQSMNCSLDLVFH